MDSFPTRWQADGNRARGLKKATSQARGRGKSSRPVLPRKVHYHLPPGFLSQNSRLPLLALSSPMTSLLRPLFLPPLCLSMINDHNLMWYYWGLKETKQSREHRFYMQREIIEGYWPDGSESVTLSLAISLCFRWEIYYSVVTQAPTMLSAFTGTNTALRQPLFGILFSQLS